MIVSYISGRRFHEVLVWPRPIKDVTIKEDQVLNCLKFTLIDGCIECESLRGRYTYATAPQTSPYASFSIPLRGLRCSEGWYLGSSVRELWRRTHSKSIDEVSTRYSTPLRISLAESESGALSPGAGELQNCKS